jgi:hypothetical protein
VISLVVAVVFALRMIRSSDDRTADAAHVLMGLGMAGMFAPTGDPVPAPLGLVVFAAIAAWFTARLLRGDSGRAGGAAHLVVAPVAMAFMYLAMDTTMAPDMEATAETASSGHAGHLTGATDTGVGAMLLAALSLVIAAYFVWHTWDVAGRAPRAPAANPEGPTGRLALATRAVPAAHVAMSGLMASMFLQMV